MPLDALENQHPYEKWKAVTEADFVTLFIKTWFAFVSTLRELYADKAKPYYEASGDSPFMKIYKEDFADKEDSADKFFFLCSKSFSEIEEPLRNTYKAGLEIISKKYPRFIVQDFYDVNLSFADKDDDEYSNLGGYTGKLFLSIKCVSGELLKVSLRCNDKKFLAKIHTDYILFEKKINYKEILDDYVAALEIAKKSVGEDELITFFYKKVFEVISSALGAFIADTVNSFPNKGYSQVKQVFSFIQGFCSRTIESMRNSCMDSAVAKKHKLLSQMPIQGFLQNHGGLTSTVERYAYIWFIGFAYRLRNALFHEIIDPLDVTWQQVFKNAYLVLKQIVDVNISRLKTVAKLKEDAISIYQTDFREARPSQFPADGDMDFENELVELKRYNATGAKVHIESTIKCKGVAYHVECDVRWDGDLKNPTVKHVQISNEEQMNAEIGDGH